MNPQLLIDALVRQTTVLLAQLSTVAGVRAPLAHVADQIFLDLAREIEAQGVSRKVAADMFGLALRTYQTKVQRLAKNTEARDETLWESLLAHLEKQGEVDRKGLLSYFHREDPNDVGAVLNDLVQSGLVERVTTNGAPRFRAAPLHERKARLDREDAESVAALVWIAIYRGLAQPSALMSELGLEEHELTEALATLEAAGRISQGADGGWQTTGVLIPVGSERGWEAAVFDHYQALVTAITRKLNRGVFSSAADDVVGGATLSFELHQDHPLRDEVRGSLRRVRTELDELWRRVGEYNRTHPPPERGREIVSFYFGQSTSVEDES